MKKIMLAIILIIIIFFSLFILFNKNSIKRNTGKINIVVSNFASYDFLREIIGDSAQNIELTFLLGPGKEMHSYDPTVQDLIKIQQADLFVYVGKEAEQWVPRVLSALDTKKTQVICISDYVEKHEEKEIEGAEESNHNHKEGAFNEHIWTSPTNAIKMVEVLENEMEKIDNKNREIYRKNADMYIQEIEDIKDKIQQIVDKKVRNRLVFGDKMPMQYFIEEFNLEVSCAFNGCSTETEPSSNTITYLVNLVKSEQIPVVLYCELNDGRVAKLIADEANQNVITMQIQTLHNVSKDDFTNGETWVSLMKRNLNVLENALY